MTTQATAPWRSRIAGSGQEAPNQLLANPGNWRIHPKAQQAALAGALDTVGWVQQILVNQRSGFVVDGHARVALALSRGEASVPVLCVDLDPDEEALVLATLTRPHRRHGHTRQREARCAPGRDQRGQCRTARPAGGLGRREDGTH
jgi:hypothetical protein